MKAYFAADAQDVDQYLAEGIMTVSVPMSDD